MFVAIGWRGVITHYSTHGVIVRRWMQEEGWEGIVAERTAHRRWLQEQDRQFRRQVAKLGSNDRAAVPYANFNATTRHDDEQQHEAHSI